MSEIQLGAPGAVVMAGRVDAIVGSAAPRFPGGRAATRIAGVARATG